MFLIIQDIFIQDYYKNILYLYQLKNTLNILIALLGFIGEILMECPKEILKI